MIRTGVAIVLTSQENHGGLVLLITSSRTFYIMSYIRKSNGYPDAPAQHARTSYPDSGDVLSDLRKLSAGNIGRVGSTGPVLVPRPPVPLRLGNATLHPALTRTDRMLIVILAAVSLSCLIGFRSWCLNHPDRP